MKTKLTVLQMPFYLVWLVTKFYLVMPARQAELGEVDEAELLGQTEFGSEQTSLAVFL